MRCGAWACCLGVLVMTWSQVAVAAVQTKTITYRDGDVECQGYLAYDDAVAGPRPGVLVVHEWWGLDEYAKRRTRELAEIGYVAFAADMYGQGKTVAHPKDAGEMAGTVRQNVAAWRKRAQAALQVLSSQPQCDPGKLAAIGYCFGGSTALQLAYSGADLKAVATFHAALPVPNSAEAQQLKTEILVCHGADDGFIPAEAIASFRKSLDEAQVTYDFVAYPQAVHSFTVPDSGKHNIPGMQYQEAADKDSWARMKALFARKLQAAP